MYEEDNASSAPTPEQPERPAGQKKRKKGRRAYLEDIHRTADGSYVYTGPCFEYDAEVNTRGSVLLRLWLLLLPALAASVISTCFNVPFMRDTWYTIAPYAFELTSIGAAVWAAGRITANGTILREYVRRQTFGALPVRCWLAVGFAGAGVAGAAAFMLAHGVQGEPFRCAAYLALKAVVIVCCAFTARFAPSVAWSETAEKV